MTVLTVTGLYQSWRGLGSWDAFTGTSYGRILIAKVGAVVVLLLVAAGYSRRWTGRLLVAETEVQSEVRVAEQVPVQVPVGGSAPGDGSSDDAPDDVRPDTSPSPSSPLPPTGVGCAVPCWPK